MNALNAILRNNWKAVQDRM